MVLFGEALAELPLIIWAWQLAARKGLGDQHSPMTLVKVEAETAVNDWQSIWALAENATSGRPSREPRIKAHPSMLEMTPAQRIGQVSQAQLTLMTPTRLQHKGRICEPERLTADILLTSLWRKLELYLHHYTDVQIPPMPTRQEIELHPHSLVRQRWERHSNRQQTAMRLDGMLGTLSLHGPLEDWWPWLWLGQYTHIGKNTSFGLGQYWLNTDPIES